MSHLHTLKKELGSHANPKKAQILKRFFKTGKGEYAEGDRFLGVMVPQSRAVAKRYRDLSFPDITKLLRSKIHEERLVAVLLLVYNFERGTSEEKKKIYEFYLRSTKYINNWDLVDLSADKIVGAYLLDKSTSILVVLARSKNLWERRIAIIATFAFIKKARFDATLRIAKMLLGDEHDLIHKAVGWMLREVGKRSQETEEDFLKHHYKRMPRTALRYAIERFPQKLRKKYLNLPPRRWKILGTSGI